MLSSYYTIHWDRLPADPAERMDALARLAETVSAQTRAARAGIVGDTVTEMADRHGQWGAQSRAAAVLGISKSQISDLYGDHREKAP